MKLKDVKVFAVHNGVFHVDDLLCSVFAKLCNPDVNIIRTRDEAAYSKCDLVVDVGGGKYDHHSDDIEELVENIRYASVGLMWRDFKTEILTSILGKQGKELTPQLEEYLDDITWRQLLLYVCGEDNGFRKYYSKSIPTARRYPTIADVVRTYNDSYIVSEEENNKVFYDALDFLMVFFESFIFEYVVAYEENIDVDDRIEHSGMRHFAGKFLKLYDYNPLKSKHVREKRYQEVWKDQLQPVVWKGGYTVVNSSIKNIYSGVLSIPTIDYMAYIMRKSRYNVIGEYIKRLQRKMDYIFECGEDILSYVKDPANKEKTYIYYDKFCNINGLLDATSGFSSLIFKDTFSGDYIVKPIIRNKKSGKPAYCFPEEYKNLRDEELQQISQIPTAIYCNNTGSMLRVGSLEDAIEIANRFDKVYKENLIYEEKQKI